MVNIYKEEYDWAYGIKNEACRQKYDYKKLKDLNYQPDQPQQPDQSKPPWAKVLKSRFNAIESIITKDKKSGLKTRIDKKEFKVNDMEKLIKDVPSNKITLEEVIAKYKSIGIDIIKISNLRITKNQNEILDNFEQLREIFVVPTKINNKETDDETDDKRDDETDGKKPGTTDMPALERVESAAQRNNQTGQGLKILTPDQMLSRLTVALAQLKAGKNSKKLKNETRQLLYLIYRSKKLIKTIYKHLINTS